MTRVAPVGEADAVRARLPAVLEAYAMTRETVLEGGMVDRKLKELCARYLAAADDEPAGPADRLADREQAALDWAYATAWDSDAADDALWERLHRHFSEPELVELGYFIAFTLGQQHWLRTLGIDPLDG